MQAPPLSPARLRRVGRTAQLLALALFLGAVSLAGFASIGPAQAHALVAPEADAPTAEASDEALETSQMAPDALDPVVPTDPADETETLEPEARVIRGSVTDATNAQPLVGANVVVVGTRMGAVTDLSGDFVLNGVDPGDVQLRITFVGYAPLTVVPQADEPLRIGLVPQILEERLIQERVVEVPRSQEGRVVERRLSPEAPEVFEVVEQRPELIDGLDGLQRTVVYPPEALASGMEGKVFVQFVVNEQGGVQDAQAVRCPDERLCEAALTAIRAAQFRPGRQRGKAVKVRFTLPIDFSLADGE